MMSNICLKHEKSKCSVGCYVGSSVTGREQESLW